MCSGFIHVACNSTAFLSVARHYSIYGKATFCLFLHQSMNVCIVFSFWSLWTGLLCIFMYKFWSDHMSDWYDLMFLVFLHVYFGAKLLDCMVVGAQLRQSCPTLCDPMDCSPPDSVHGILQARILEWVAMPSSRGASRPRDLTRVSYCVSCTGRQVLPRSTAWEARMVTLFSAAAITCYDCCWQCMSVLISPRP